MKKLFRPAFRKAFPRETKTKPEKKTLMEDAEVQMEALTKGTTLLELRGTPNRMPRTSAESRQV